MARKPKRTAVARRPEASTAAEPASAVEAAPDPDSPRSRPWTILAVIGLLALHYAMAARSLIRENPTIDEVAHMPAGITYWQKGTFKLYHHNPPLFKLVAALPVVLARPVTEPLYQYPSWRSKSPSQATFAHSFSYCNADRYFELFRLARLMMPIFGVIGGFVVFAWSSRLYGSGAGLLSLTLYAFCPNILAFARLVTSDLCSTSMGVAATYVFWRYLDRPTWRWAVGSGVLLGLAQLSKFSMLLLYAVWPLLWLAHLVMVRPDDGAAPGPRALPRRVLQGLVHGVAVVGLSVLTIDAGYFFEGIGIPLGQFEFGSGTLTRPVPPGTTRPGSDNPLLRIVWQFRENRFRGTWLEGLPSPLPEHYLLGFDEQKIEAEGIPSRYLAAIRDGRVDDERRVTPPGREVTEGYWVYLDGILRPTGWSTYYVRTLLYKVPEGTWLLVVLSLVIVVVTRRTPARWFDELALLMLQVVFLASMSLFTDINLGLRYVLAIFPYVFIATGKVVPWALGLRKPLRRVAGSFVVGSTALTLAASLWIHPSYLAYFNWALGGPDRRPPHLIDSNLDWGQDLVALHKWCRENIPDQKIGLAYFGQFNPSLLARPGEPFDWFLPPSRPGTVHPMPEGAAPRLPGPPQTLKGPAPRLTPGYYAVSATLLYGLPWRLYDPAPLSTVPTAIQPKWNDEVDAFGYFRQFTPIMPPIGHSIYVYRLTEEDVARANRLLERPAAAETDARSGAPATDKHLREVDVMRRTEEDIDFETRATKPVR